MATENPADSTPAPDTSAADEAAYQAGLAAMLKGEPADEPAAEPEPKAEDDAPAEEDTAEEPEAEEPEPEADEDTDEESEDDEDPKVDKDALRKLQKEKRSFEAHKTKVLELERQVATREKQAETRERELSDFIGKLRTDPFTTLIEAKLLSEEDISFAARQLYLMSPEAAKDPRSKAEAERLRRERERDMKAERAEREVERLRREREEERAQQAEERKLADYTSRIDSTTQVFKEKTPLLTKALAKDSAATKRELYQIAYELATANGGQLAEPGKVVLAWEKQQRERIARLGLEAPAVQSKAKTPTAAKSQGQPPKKKEPAPVAEEPAELSEEEYRAELRRRLKQS
jgi:hypothetical protein